MKYNKHYIPHHRLAILIAVLDVLVVAGIHEIIGYFVEEIEDISFSLSENIGEGIFILVVLFLMLIIATLAIFAALVCTEGFCRPVKFTQQGVECGFILKDRISWKSITAVYMAPLLVYRTDNPLSADTVCIVCGSFSESLLTYVGAAEIRNMIFLKHHFKNLNKWFQKKVYKVDESIEYPKMLIWLQTSDKVREDIIKKWQETR